MRALLTMFTHSIASAAVLEKSIAHDHRPSEFDRKD
jgi:hypothetical protein